MVIRRLSLFRRLLSSSASAKPVMVTSPIFYVNGSPHIGHLHSVVLCDALHRWHDFAASGSPRGFLSTGTDEHGLKIQQAASRAGLAPLPFTTSVSSQFRSLADAAQADVSAFIRTTEPSHKHAVQTMWRTLRDRGFIYKDSYAGWYSVADEAFVPESQTIVRGDSVRVAADSGQPVEWLVEENYKFRLSALVPRLLEWLHARPDAVLPASRHNEVVAWLEGKDIVDISVSRRKDKVQWAIDVPDDSEHSVYVWLDALTNYVTVTGYPYDGTSSYPIRKELLPIDFHVIGKDILRFHAVYWPAFLMAAELPLPKHIIAHSHWTVDKQKMSKSKGNVVDPFELIRQYGVDNVRYFLMREAKLADDADFSHKMLVTRCNSELSNTLGNLLSRSTGAAMNPSQSWPDARLEANDIVMTDRDKALLASFRSLPARVKPHFDLASFHEGLQLILDALYETNRYYNDLKPWALPADSHERHVVLAIAMEAVRVSAMLLYSVIPAKAEEVLHRLNVPRELHQDWGTLQRPPVAGTPLQPISATNGVFPRIK